MSLRNQLIAFSIVMGTVPIIATGTVSYLITNPSLENAAISYQQARAIAMSNRITQTFGDIRGDLKAVAGLGIVVTPNIIATTPLEDKEKILESFRTAKKIYNDLLVADTTGKVNIQIPERVTTTLVDDLLFRQIIQRGNFAVAEPKLDDNGKYVIEAGRVAKNLTTGKTVAVVKTKIAVDEIERLLKEATVLLAESGRNYQQENYYIIDGDGKIFISTEKDLLGQNVGVIVENYRQLQASGKPVSQEFRDKLVTYVPISTGEGMEKIEWGVLILNDTDEVFAAQRNLVLALVGLVVGTGVAMSAIAAWVANGTTSSLNEIATAIAESSTEIAATMEQQERTVNHQATAVNQTTTTMNELGTSSRHSASQAEASAIGAKKVLSLGDRGMKAVDNTSSGMNTIRAKAGETAGQILHLSEIASQISSISTIISDIANRTNILALNAGVEAVRAGEHGKGFGVVASEIRKLADQSKSSAEKIVALVLDIQNAINLTVMMTDETIKTVETGVEIFEETSTAFTGVRDAINEIVMSTQQISLNAQQQVQAIEQVVDAMNTLNGAARETVSGISNVKTRVQQLQIAAQNLKQMI
ncbi:methyl-accepting chemotaxis protein [[Phormidium] sp. ETS-05]|uniref:methyl-accepting chemotaxis protein n=1 Tax=[Phormidium] sp. ETS-05 TaxID=222819 RepID=UPI0018EF06BA|nr:methyl-accepting chemotaxis protein [[Phormidium] sp. ETS-05]